MKDAELPKAIICDIDGTIALVGDRNLFDPTSGEDGLNYPIANILQVYDQQTIFDVSLLLITGRDEKYRKHTENWLSKHGITHYKKLYMRPTGDFRKDFVVKKEIYEQEIQDVFEVLFVLEDRDQVVKMWRGEGLTCLQVAYGDF
jgi:hypothetical protein